MKRILIVSWYYYPASAVGARRIYNFKKYLEHFGHEVTVLAADERYYDDTDAELNAPQYRQQVERTRPRFYLRVPPRKKQETLWEGGARRAKFILSLQLSKFLFPDAFAGWIRPAVRRAEMLHRLRPFDVVISSGTPWSSFVAGDRFASRHALPHVMDYRDPWTAHEQGSFASELIRARSAELESELLRRASRVIVNSNDTVHLFARRFGAEVQRKLLCVRNGFDPEIYTVIKRRAESDGPSHDAGKFCLVHTGMYYASRRLNTFIEAVNRLVQEGVVNSENFEMISFGTFNADDRRLLERFGLEALFREQDFVPYEASLLALTRCSMSLLIVGAQHAAQIPAKLYDYLMVEKPIFAVGPVTAEVKTIIETHQYGLYADISNSSDIAEKLGQAMSLLKRYGGRVPLRAPDEFNVRDQVYKLSQSV